VLELLFGLERRRRRLLARTPAGPLREFLSMPFPRPGRDCREAGFVAVDLEATGLDPAEDEIVSIGWVCLEGVRIDLSTARHRLVRASRDIPEESAVLHGITDDRAARGAPLQPVLQELLAVLAGRVLVAHNATFELQFLDAACLHAFGGRLLVPAVDTLWLAREWLERGNIAYQRAELRLDALRRRHNLPRYRAHNALSDALAAAELFIAQVAQRENGRALPLRALLLQR
jgi:DNA polymerase III subunit epsilon